MFRALLETPGGILGSSGPEVDPGPESGEDLVDLVMRACAPAPGWIPARHSSLTGNSGALFTNGWIFHFPIMA